MTERRRRLPAWWMMLMLAVAFFLTTAQASAKYYYECGGQKDDCQCGANNPFPCCESVQNGGNCTWWAWEAACCHWKANVPMRGNAKTWAEVARRSPDYKVLDHPVVNSIACRDIGDYGHVAWVIKVDGNNVTVTEENWCKPGMRQHTYPASYFTGGYIVRANQQCDCKSGDTQTKPCEKCGHKTRKCADGCNWGSWSSCKDQGECEKDAKESDKCGSCGTHERVCSKDCHWGDWGPCEGPDPESGKQSCDTGKLGVCAEGLSKCVHGELTCVAQKEPSAEQCNELDDDCDGQTDEDGVCGGQGGGSGADAGYPPTEGGVLGDAWVADDDAAVDASSPGRSKGLSPEETSGCACRVGVDADPRGPAGSSVALLLGAWLLVERRRRRSLRR